ncbi:MAG: hypothetical protein ACKV2T_42730 [Kofleriaceae bacterium]
MSTIRVVAVIALVALVAPPEAEACFEPAFEQHQLERSQLSDTVKPGPVSISMWIEEPDSGGCTMPAREKCGPVGRRLVVLVSASDDQTPPDKLGYRVLVTAGRSPFAEPGDVRPFDGSQLHFELGDSEDFDFELAIRAIDLNGNIGPATYTRVAQAQGNEGCTSHHGRGALSSGVIGIVLALLVRRRRRRC